MTVLSCFTCSKRRTQAWPVDMVEVYVRMFVTTLYSEFEANFLANFSIMMYAHHTPHTHTTSLSLSLSHTHTQHDPATTECQPSTGGNYIMFASASTGSQPNNDAFSPCSIRAMEAIITSRAQQPTGCFIGETLCVRVRVSVCVWCVCMHVCVFELCYSVVLWFIVCM